MVQTAASITAKARGRRKKRLSAIWLQFLGSMNLAISLLVVVAIASVIGTVLPQNQPYIDYLVQFGPFWFEVFRLLNLYDVYSAAWFLFILGFLILSTGVCVSRHMPAMWREVTRYRTHVREQSLLALSQHQRWQAEADTDTAAAVATGALQGHGYRIRTEQRGDSLIIGGMQGRSMRLGYILTHVAVVVIAIGGLVDGNLPLKLMEMRGDVRIERENLPLSRVPSESWIAPETGAFQGSVNIPEGSNSGVVFLQLRDGYLVQELPFEIVVEQFRIEHYPNGMPSSYESDLVIHDPDLAEPIRQTISVNHPLTHRGHTIYQASFGDGGTRMEITGRLLDGTGAEVPISGRIFEDLNLELGAMERTLELDDFQLLNIQRDTRAVTRTGARSEFVNSGPSFNYTLRDEAGQARYYHTYMAPVRVEDQWYYLHGMRMDEGEPFRYLHIPIDDRSSMNFFMEFHQALHDRNRVDAASQRAADTLLTQMGVANPQLVSQVARTADEMIRYLLNGGFGAVEAHLESRVQGAANAPMLREFSQAVLQRTLFEIYLEMLADRRGVTPAALQVEDPDRRFFEDAMNAVSGVAEYGAPLILQLDHFEYRQATGLMITRSPGKGIVYTGSALLIIGIFLLFYVSHRRVWAMITPKPDGTTDVLMGGVNQRRPEQFEEEFASLTRSMDQHLGSVSQKSKD
ncbi:MAG: cytochrome c biogenesis protein ResB [Gammaproteobacteria bacterium]|nr:cytochrome c biogenesis protein ResB [Gammaproteobacteria bacterium]